MTSKRKGRAAEVVSSRAGRTSDCSLDFATPAPKKRYYYEYLLLKIQVANLVPIKTLNYLYPEKLKFLMGTSWDHVFSHN